jgi:hypothetical protein
MKMQLTQRLLAYISKSSLLQSVISDMHEDGKMDGNM